MEPNEAAARLIDEALERRQADRFWKARWFTLTRREREVLVLARQGRTNEQIAESLTISPSTVKIHLKRLLRKLNLQRKSQLRERLGELEMPPES
jgi:RNA polymerase sigma factor (sigma-70 family)